MSVQAANSLALDANGLAELKRQSRDDPRAGAKLAAQQFESLFLQMVMKAMRDTVPGGGLFDNQEGKLYQSLLDQQLSQTMASRSATGLAALIEKQLTRSLPLEGPLGEAVRHPSAGIERYLQQQALQDRERQGLPPPPATGAIAADRDADRVARAADDARAAPLSAHAPEFAQRMWRHAAAAGNAIGVPPEFLVAQAALETGWGRKELRFADGRPTHNLFNIKAGRSWNGPTMEVIATEYVNGAERQQVERFRAYGSYAEAFADYARLIQSRYAGVVGSRDALSFARGLQEGGYATDPRYAEKLMRVIDGAALQGRS